MDLIKHAIKEASIHKLMHAVSKFEKEQLELSEKVDVYVLRNHTLNNFQWFLKGLGYLDRMVISCKQSGYDAIMKEILDPDSLFRQSSHDVVVLSLVLENLTASYRKDDFSTKEVIKAIKQMVESLIANCSAPIICNTFLMPIHNSEGIFSHKNTDSIENKIYEINSWLRRLCQDKKRLYLIDWNQLEQKLGASYSRDYRLWYVAKSLLKNKFLKEYAFEVVKLIKLLNGKSKKCLILDCDDTLWGGIIGEDGLERIQLNPHDYPGNIFYSFQQNILHLAERGILIVLCSKNNEEDVWQVLDSHTHCLIKRSHLAAWRINWESKVDNIESLAKELNLGKDSFVFVDDNPLECKLIKDFIPEVAVLQVPKDLSTYPSLLLENRLFDTILISQEDRKRTLMYQAEAMRKVEHSRYDNLDDFLKSLQLIVTIGRVGPCEVQRVAQLSQKTNQFNLTTKRYSEEDIERLAKNQNYELVYLKVKDQFGDSGIVGACILEYERSSAIFDTFLISCRVLGRKVEDVFLKYCLKIAQDKGMSLAKGYYFSTTKNNAVKDFYKNNGFVIVNENIDERVFTYDMSGFKWQEPDFLQKLIINKKVVVADKHERS